MNSEGWTKTNRWWTHSTEPDSICPLTKLVPPNYSKESGRTYLPVVPVLPKFPLSITDNSHGAIHVSDADGNIVSFISYNDGSRTGANDISIEMALGFALKLVETFKA